MCSEHPTGSCRVASKSSPCNAARARVSGRGAMQHDAQTGSTVFWPSTPTAGGAVGRSISALHRHRRTSLNLVDLVELVEVLENKLETHNRVGTESTESRSSSSMPGSSGRSGSPRPSLVAPDNPRAWESTSGNVRHPVGVGADVRRLRVGSALSPAPATILSDHAVATWLQPAPFGCDNPPTRQPAPSVRPGGDGGDEGVGKKVADMRSDHPLHVHCGHQLASPIC